MKLISIKIGFLLTIFFVTKNVSQETLPIYTDYLSDNVYLVHPSAAGIGNTQVMGLFYLTIKMGIIHKKEFKALMHIIYN